MLRKLPIIIYNKNIVIKWEIYEFAIACRDKYHSKKEINEYDRYWINL